jgi:hypothetical protein
MKNSPPTFQTDYIFVDRETKAKYVWLKYQSILERASILDVGADECHLRKHLPHSAKYWGIGLGGNPDQQVDLEKEKIPFPNRSYDCVLCLDVLEHIENIHEVFDELCRVSSKYVIVSLPNAWRDFYAMLRSGEHKPGQALKFYGLPLERPVDRHKWFFSNDEARFFVQHRAAKNNMIITQMDNQDVQREDDRPFMRYWRELARDFLFRKDLKMDNLYTGNLWAVLERNDA